MSLLFPSDALSDEELTTLSPANFTISGCLCLKELAEEVLQVFGRRCEDVSKIHIAISDSFSFEIYRNALRYIFYYIYFFACHQKDGADITIDAAKEEGKMLLTLTSEDGSVKELYETLSGQLPAMEADRMDNAFRMRIFQHFAQSALEQVCDGTRYEDKEESQCLTLVFSPVKASESSSVKKTVLLLEDCDEMVWLISNLLSDEFVVHRVKTIQAAFEYVKQNTPAVFLVDMLMYADAEGTFMEYVNKHRSLLSKAAFVPMLSWQASSTVQQELIKWSDSYIVLPYDILFLNNVIYKTVYGKQEAKQIYVEELGSLSEQIICYTQEQADFVKRFLLIVEQNLDKEDLGSTFIADRMAMSPRQFYRKLKDISGMSPSDLIKNYRMDKAARLLSNDELSIQDVISDVGIASRSYFYKEFTRKFGVTPKDYRESHKK